MCRLPGNRARNTGGLVSDPSGQHFGIGSMVKLGQESETDCRNDKEDWNENEQKFRGETPKEISVSGVFPGNAFWEEALLHDSVVLNAYSESVYARNPARFHKALKAGAIIDQRIEDDETLAPPGHIKIDIGRFAARITKIRTQDEIRPHFQNHGVRGSRVKLPDIPGFLFDMKIGPADQAALDMRLHASLKLGLFADTHFLPAEGCGNRQRHEGQAQQNCAKVSHIVSFF